MGEGGGAAPRPLALPGAGAAHVAIRIGDEADGYYDDGGMGMVAAVCEEEDRQYWVAQGASVEAVPGSVVSASWALSALTLGSAVADALVEALILGGLVPKLPLRPEFLVLVGMSALLGFHTLRGIKRCELDVTVDALQVGVVVELALVFGDVLFLTQEGTAYAALMRAPFVFCSLANVLLMLYIASRLHLFPEFFHRRKAQKRRKEAAREHKAARSEARRNVRRKERRSTAVARREAKQAAGGESLPNLPRKAAAPSPRGGGGVGHAQSCVG